MTDRRWQWMPRLITIGLGSALLAMEALNGASHRNFWALGPCALQCFGLVMTLMRKERIGTVASLSGIIGVCWLRPSLVSTSLFYAPLQVLLILLQPHERRRAGLITTVGVCAALWLSRRAIGPSEWLTAITAWLCVYALPWAAAAAANAFREAGRREFTERMEVQRRTIAAELHDNVAHELSLIVMRAEAARGGVADAQKELAYIASAGRRANQYLRNVMPLLHMEAPEMLSLPMELQRCECALHEAGLEARLEIDGDLRVIPTAPADTLARIIREATNNAVRHARRTGPCSIRIKATAAQTDIAVINAGNGPVGHGLGMDGMAERIRSIGGQFSAGPVGTLWVVRASAPYPPIRGE